MYSFPALTCKTERDDSDTEPEANPHAFAVPAKSEEFELIDIFP